MDINNILVAVAGRGLCEEMLNMLMDIPTIQRANITLLHVVPSQASAEKMAAMLETGGKILAQAVQSIKVDSSHVNPRLKQGDPKDIVNEVAEEENSDLIIMGSRGLQGLRAILENSVSQYVFQLTSRPMLLVKDDTYVKKLRQIMVALDPSESAAECLQTGLNWAQQIPGGELILAHINKDLSGKSAEDFSANAAQDPILTPGIEAAKRQGVKYRCVSGVGKPARKSARSLKR